MSLLGALLHAAADCAVSSCMSHAGRRWTPHAVECASKGLAPGLKAKLARKFLLLDHCKLAEQYRVSQWASCSSSTYVPSIGRMCRSAPPATTSGRHASSACTGSLYVSAARTSHQQAWRNRYRYHRYQQGRRAGLPTVDWRRYNLQVCRERARPASARTYLRAQRYQQRSPAGALCG